MAIDPREGLFEHTKFAGLRNNVDEGAFALEDLSAGLNVDIDDELWVHRRKGFSAPVIAGSYHSLESFGAFALVVTGSTLVYIRPDLSVTIVRTGLTPNLPMDYSPLGDRVYYSNGAESGVVQNGVSRTWGLAVPAVVPAAVVGGALPPGRYQYTLTYLRGDGQESGAQRARVVELAETGGLILTLPVSLDPTVTHTSVYVSAVNGETVLKYATVVLGTATVEIREQRMGTVPLETQFLSPPPPGADLGYYNGAMLVAVLDRLYPSQPYAPELFDLRRAIPFLDRITMVAPVEDGVWLGTKSQVVWLSGTSYETWLFKDKANYGVLPGTLAYADGELLGDRAAKGDKVAFFATTAGLCAGRPGGVLENLTENRFAYPAMGRGAGIVRKHRGLIQYVATLQGVETPGNVFA